MPIKPCPRCKDWDTPAARYQNELYGYGKRVFNKRANGGYRCTICGYEIPPPTKSR